MGAIVHRSQVMSHACSDKEQDCGRVQLQLSFKCNSLSVNKLDFI